MSESSPHRTLEFDLRGQICPSTLLTALREINRNAADLRSGQVALVFRTDHRDAVGTIPEAAAHMGHRTAVTRSDGCYRIMITGAGWAEPGEAA